MNVQKIIQTVAMTLGGFIGYFLGDIDGLLKTLLMFIVVDYATGVMVAVHDKTLSSHVGFKGILKKVLMLMLVGVCNILDKNLVGSPMLRTAIIFFYISNEGISIIENATRMGLPVPEKFKDVLEQLKTKGDK